MRLSSNLPIARRGAIARPSFNTSVRRADIVARQPLATPGARGAVAARRRALQQRATNLRTRRVQQQITHLKARDRALEQKLRSMATASRAAASRETAPDYSQPYYPQQAAQPALDYSQPYYPQGEGFAPTSYDDDMDYSGDAAAKLFEVYAEGGNNEGADEGADGEDLYYEYETELGATRRPARGAPPLTVAGVPVVRVAFGVAALAALYYMTRKPRRGR